MSTARDAVLARIRGALADVPPGAASTMPRDYRRAEALDRDALVARFAERVRDYGADVRTAAPDAVGEVVGDACSGVGPIVVPADLPEAWRPRGAEVVADDGRPGRELDAFAGAVTGCAVAIADTGTLVLDGGAAQGRRAITLVPDHHVCVVRAEQVAGLVPEALARLEDPTRPITLVSGPSATSDIELRRVQGVHGPRRLVVVLVSAP